MSDVDISDAERERYVRDLTRHCGDGRITLDELEERVAEVYAASTRAQLEHAMRQLPVNPAFVPPEAAPQIVAAASATPARSVHHPYHYKQKISHGAEVALKAHLYTYLSVMALLTLIWLLTSAPGHFWPIWPGITWGTGVAIQAGVTKAVTTGRDR